MRSAQHFQLDLRAHIFEELILAIAATYHQGRRVRVI